MTHPAEVYGEDLRTAQDGSPATTWLRYQDGRTLVLDLPRWSAPATGGDVGLLRRCTGAVLDIGCGPGRLTRALTEQGRECLGVDVAPVAVALARVGGTPVLHASIYDDVLDETRWDTVLLADGNIGIGGDPCALLRRCRHLLMPAGRVLVELDPPTTDSQSGPVIVRVESSTGRTSDWFTWAHVSVGTITALAEQVGLGVHERWQASGRWFTDLRNP